MIRTLITASALLLAAPATAQDETITAEVIEESDGTRTLVHEAVIHAPVADVWATLSTAEGWKHWGPKEAWFDFRPGGEIETSYNAGAKPGDGQNIKHRILAYVPERMIALQVAKVPDGAFKPGVLDGMWSVYELTPVFVADPHNREDATELRIIGIGYKSDPDSSQMLEFFKTGNVYSIEVLKKVLETRAAE